MHILKNGFIIILSVLFLFSCKAKGPISPEEAFDFLKNAYLSSDAGNIENLLSERSKEKIKTIISIFSSMSESQLTALSEKFCTNPDTLKNLTIQDYISMRILKNDDDVNILKEITKHKMIGVDEKDGKAIVRIENGMEIFFLKEDHYWKFDMEELSSKNN